MGTIASKGQLRWSFIRWAAVTVPLMLLIGFGSGRTSPSGDENAWYMALDKPALNPPNWAFPVAWTSIYICMGLAIAIVLNARGARGRWPGVACFAVVVALLAAWTPVFFGAHRIWAGLAIILAILLLGIATTVLFARVRRSAAWLMVPLLVWVSFAAGLNWRIGQLNPDAERLAPASRTTQML